MLEKDPLYQYVREFMLEIMAVLWANGQTELHVGAVMRLLGVPEEHARLHDDERIDLAENFEELAQSVGSTHVIQTGAPAGATIH
jgi:hypothetical protein